MPTSSTLANLTPSLIALVVVVGWIAATLTGVGNTSDLRDVAIAVVAFYFGGNVHSAGVQSGAAVVASALAR